MIIMHKHSLLRLSFCISMFSTLCAMDRDAKRFKAIQEELAKGDRVDVERLKPQVADLSRNKDYYKKFARILHPDKTQGNKDLEELFKAASEGNEKKNKSTAITDGDIVNIQKKTEQAKELFDQIKQHSISKSSLGTTSELMYHAYSQAYIDYTMQIIFTLIEDKTIPENPENSDLQKHVNYLQAELTSLEDVSEQIKDAIEIYTDYQEELKEAQTRIDQRNQDILKKYFNKGKK